MTVAFRRAALAAPLLAVACATGAPSTSAPAAAASAAAHAAPLDIAYRVAMPDPASHLY